MAKNGPERTLFRVSLRTVLGIILSIKSNEKIKNKIEILILHEQRGVDRGAFAAGSRGCSNRFFRNRHEREPRVRSGAQADKIVGRYQDNHTSSVPVHRRSRSIPRDLPDLTTHALLDDSGQRYAPILENQLGLVGGLGRHGLTRRRLP